MTYWYYSRYVSRTLTFTEAGFTIRVGKRFFEYPWKEFSIVALSMASSATGTKGHVIRLYVSDLDGEYVDLPMYRFTKIIDTFELREQIEATVRLNQPQIKIKRSNVKS